MARTRERTTCFRCTVIDATSVPRGLQRSMAAVRMEIWVVTMIGQE